MPKGTVLCYELKPGLLREHNTVRLRVDLGELRAALNRHFGNLGWGSMSDADILAPACSAVFDQLLGEDGWDVMEEYYCRPCACYHVRPLLNGKEVQYGG